MDYRQVNLCWTTNLSNMHCKNFNNNFNCYQQEKNFSFFHRCILVEQCKQKLNSMAHSVKITDSTWHKVRLQFKRCRNNEIPFLKQFWVNILNASISIRWLNAIVVLDNNSLKHNPLFLRANSFNEQLKSLFNVYNVFHFRTKKGHFQK